MPKLCIIQHCLIDIGVILLIYGKYFIVNEGNITTLIGNLTNICWENVLNAVEVDTAYAEFLSIFSEQYNICCPVKTIRAQVARRDKPWITNGLKKCLS